MDIHEIRSLIRDESPWQIDTGIIVGSDPRGSRYVSVRLSGGRVISNVYTCTNLLENGQSVVVLFVESASRPIVLGGMLEPTEANTSRKSVTAPPDNISVAGSFGLIVYQWDTYPGDADICWQVQHNSTASEVDAIEAIITRGSYYLYPCAAGTTRHFRVRAVRWLGDSNLLYSGWSGWSDATSMGLDETYPTKAELASTLGASLIGIADAGELYESTTVEGALQEIISGGGLVGGSDKQIQFNDSGVFGGHADMTFDKTLEKIRFGAPASPQSDAAGAGFSLIGDGRAFSLGIETYGSNTPAVAGFAASGSIAAPTAALLDRVLMRVSGRGYGATGFPGVSNARVDLVAAEDQTDTAQGTRIEFWTTPIGSATIGRDVVISPGSLSYKGKTDTAERAMALDEWLWANATDGSRKARRVWSVYDTAVREGMRIEASGAAPMIGFLGAAAIVRPTALTAQLTTITHTAPGTPDYAIQDFVSGGAGWAFANHDEANSVLAAIANLQARMDELEDRLGHTAGLGLITH